METKNHLMKYVLLFFLSGICMLSNAQNCDRVNAFNSFKGIKLGGTFPDSLRGYGIMMPNKGDTSFAIGRYKLDDRPDLLKFLNFKEDFETLAIYTGKNRRIHSLVLITSADEENQKAFDDRKIPPFFLKMVEELTTRFGKKTSSGARETGLGTERFVKWQCEHVQIELLYRDFMDLSFNLRIEDTKLSPKPVE
jgi:hypothetical protein